MFDHPELVARFARAAEQGVRVVAEGRISTPAQASEAIRLGAFAVTVGTALTRPELATRAFVDAVRSARS